MMDDQNRDPITVDLARLPELLTALRLPTIARLWAQLAERSDREGWPAARYLATLLEHELAERHQRRIQRHLQEADLPPGKSLATFDFASVPMISMSQINALAAGGSWLDKGANILAFGPPGVGKSHLAAGLGQALVEKGYRVLFARTTDMVQRLQAARRDFSLESLMDKLDKYDLLILDDISYVRKDQAENSVLFELISARYERRSLLITANKPFGKWDEIFPDKAMTVAAIDRLVHHAVILEINTESYRRKTAISRAPGSSSAAESTTAQPNTKKSTQDDSDE
jgi:DNA replication protein DnaC